MCLVADAHPFNASHDLLVLLVESEALSVANRAQLHQDKGIIQEHHRLEYSEHEALQQRHRWRHLFLSLQRLLTSCARNPRHHRKEESKILARHRLEVLNDEVDSLEKQIQVNRVEKCLDYPHFRAQNVPQTLLHYLEPAAVFFLHDVWLLTKFAFTLLAHEKPSCETSLMDMGHRAFTAARTLEKHLVVAGWVVL